MKTILFGMIILSLGLTCNKKGGGSSSSALNGVYSTGCIDDSGSSSIDILTFSGENLENKIVNYLSTGCLSGDETETFRREFAYTYDGAVLIMIRVKGYYTTHDAADATTMNGNSSCGINTWSADVEEDITDAANCFDPFSSGTSITVNNVQQNNNSLIFPNGDIYTKQ